MLVVAVLLMMHISAFSDTGRYAAERERMVRDQIERRGVRDGEVLRAMRNTPRHLFVPEALRGQAYADGPLPIGSGQTISQPYIVASMSALLGPSRTLRVLEIGTGSGYQAAVLAPLFRQVYSIEIVPELGTAAAELLRKLGYSNVTVRIGDGYAGWPEEAPFDRIMLTAAPPEIPQALLDQLAPGGPHGGSSGFERVGSGTATSRKRQSGPRHSESGVSGALCADGARAPGARQEIGEPLGRRSHLRRKLISIAALTRTGSPSFVPGLKRHWRTASIAF